MVRRKGRGLGFVGPRARDERRGQLEAVRPSERLPRPPRCPAPPHTAHRATPELPSFAALPLPDYPSRATRAAQSLPPSPLPTTAPDLTLAPAPDKRRLASFKQVRDSLLASV